MPKISVVLPSYNHQKYLARTIQGILGQTFGDFELLIIDDFSGDKSREIITGFARRDKRISYQFHKNNQGIARSLNEGISLARGQYIAYCSSDDIWEKDRLKTGLEIMERAPEVGLLYSEAIVIDEEGRPTNKKFSSLYPSPTGKYSGNLFDTLLGGNIICGSSILIRRSSVSGLSFNTELKYLNDWLYYLEVSERNRLFYVSQPLVKYRVHGGNTRLDTMGYARDYLLMLGILFSRYPEQIKKNRKMLAELYYNSGYFLCLSGRVKEGRQYLLESAKTSPLKGKAILAALISLPGSSLAFNAPVKAYGKIKAKLKSGQ